MKSLLIIVAFFGGLIGCAVFDATGPGRNCRVVYGTSFNGLYLIKSEQCDGRLTSLPRTPREIARRPLFREF